MVRERVKTDEKNGVKEKFGEEKKRGFAVVKIGARG